MVILSAGMHNCHDCITLACPIISRHTVLFTCHNGHRLARTLCFSSFLKMGRLTAWRVLCNRERFNVALSTADYYISDCNTFGVPCQRGIAMVQSGVYPDRVAPS